MKRVTVKVAASIATAVLALSISACSNAAPQPEAISTPTPETPGASSPATPATPSPEPPAAANIGTRENPVPIGQVLAFSPESAFKVGAAGPTQVTAGYSVLPLAIQIDWANFNEQSVAQGLPTGGPVSPLTNFGVSFVTESGKSYMTMDDYNATIPDQLFEIGDVYEGTDVVNANVPVSVPEGEVAGGAWVIENYFSGARVFVAPQ